MVRTTQEERVIGDLLLVVRGSKEAFSGIYAIVTG
jgi:hypothetical protein